MKNLLRRVPKYHVKNCKYHVNSPHNKGFKMSFNIGIFILRRPNFCVLGSCPLTSLKNRGLSLKISRCWGRDNNS